MHIRKTHPLVQRFWLWSSLVVFVVGMLVEAPRTAARDVKGGPAATCTVEKGAIAPFPEFRLLRNWIL